MLIYLHVRGEKVIDFLFIFVHVIEERTQRAIRRLQTTHNTVCRYVGRLTPRFNYFITLSMCCISLFVHCMQRVIGRTLSRSWNIDLIPCKSIQEELAPVLVRMNWFWRLGYLFYFHGSDKRAEQVAKRGEGDKSRHNWRQKWAPSCAMYHVYGSHI